MAGGAPDEKQRSDATAQAAGASHGSISPPAARKQLDDLTSPATPGATGYRIGPQDVLEVSVFKVPDLSKVVQVSESGSISYPLIGEVPAVGRTAQELERQLATQLGAKYLRSPQVSVSVKEYNSQRVTIDGAIKKPGVYPVRSKLSLLQLLAMCEGVDSQVAADEIVIFRQGAGKKAAAKFSLAALRSGEEKDPEVKAGDLVIVDTSAAKSTLNNILKVLPLTSLFRVI